MLRQSIMLVATLLCWSAGAQNRSSEIIDQVSANVDRLGAYRSNVEVVMGGSSLSGLFEADDHNFYVNIAGVEVYGAEGVRYEVSSVPEDRTILIDNMLEVQGASLLDNPAKAFDFVEDNFRSEIISERNEVINIALVPLDKQSGVDIITLTVDAKTMLPSSIRYEAQGEVVVLNLKSLDPITEGVKCFAKANYPDFEIVDFR